MNRTENSRFVATNSKTLEVVFFNTESEARAWVNDIADRNQRDIEAPADYMTISAWDELTAE